MKNLISPILLSLAFGWSALSAQPPPWWTDRGVIDSGGSPNDFAAVNQGQVKNIAAQAYQELLANLPGGAGAELQALTAGWVTSGGNDFVPVNLGQLKNVAQPFFGRLITVGYTDEYPWDQSINPPADYALANIGQVKNLFSFDVTFSSDSDPLPDWWRLHHFGNLNHSSGDPAPGDSSLTLGEAFSLGRDPNAASLPEAPETSGGWVGLELYTSLQ